MKEWLKRFIGRKKTVSVRPSEVPVDQRVLDLLSLGAKMLATDDFVGAVEAFESVLRLDGHCAEAWHRRGRIYMREGRLMAAMACYARSLELDPQASEGWCAQGEAILAFLKTDREPLFIRENRLEIVSEACDCFERSMKLGGDLPRAREGRDSCRDMIDQNPRRIATPRLFTFHSGGILETAKREVVSPFLKPSDYRRRVVPPLQE